MTTKDYELIANVLADATEYIGSRPKPAYKNGALYMRRNLIIHLADVFAAQNPRFDRERFYKAANFYEGL